MYLSWDASKSYFQLHLNPQIIFPTEHLVCKRVRVKYADHGFQKHSLSRQKIYFAIMEDHENQQIIQWRRWNQ